MNVLALNGQSISFYFRHGAADHSPDRPMNPSSPRTWRGHPPQSTKEVLMSFLTLSTPLVARRAFLGSGMALSGAAVALLSGRHALAAAAGAAGEADVRILNTALAAELEAVAAYQLGAESRLLQKPVLDVALAFQGHHREHAHVLARTVRQLGGIPVEARPRYAFPSEQLTSQAEVLKFAAQLEQGAVSAYLGAVPLFVNRDLAKAAASILGDEAMHWAVLRQALGLAPVPSAFLA